MSTTEEIKLPPAPRHASELHGFANLSAADQAELQRLYDGALDQRQRQSAWEVLRKRNEEILSRPVAICDGPKMDARTMLGHLQNPS